MIDNFKYIADNVLKFVGPNDRYILHVMKRAKDGKTGVGSSESNRLIKTYYIDSLEYFSRKKDAIVELCNQFNARAYLMVQPKDNFQCMLNLAKLIMENVQKGNLQAKPDRMAREAYCGYHQTSKKRWILDLDNDELNGWTIDRIKALIKNLYTEANVTDYELHEVPTRNGTHLICTPFNLQKAHAMCDKMFEGQCGWIKKDAMTLLYCN